MKNLRKTACPEILGNWYESTNSNFFQSRKNRDWKRLGTVAILTCIPKKIGTSLRSAFLFFLICIFAYLPICTFANNVSITNITATDATHIQFDIAWDNSWYLTTPPNNWDAVWVFVKTQVCTASGYGDWTHGGVSITATDHTVTGGVLQVDIVSDGKGVFIRRMAAGSGNIATATVTLKFSGSYTVANTNYEVYGIEMVYVPQGSFSVGDGSTSGSQSASSWGSSGATTPYSITGEGAIACDILANNSSYGTPTSYGCNCVEYPWGYSHPNIAAAFPKGYNAFYMMKHEISQQEYVAFLNSLNYTQQLNRTEGANNIAKIPSAATGTAVLCATSGDNRNSIEIKTSGFSFTVPAVYGNDLNNNNVFDEADDGGNIACNYLSWYDLMAYLDWSGLRPMTELEFEKACRGSGNTPVLTEYVWGNTTINQAISSALSNAGQASEVSTSTATGLCAYNAGSSTTLGPLRVGFAATASTTSRAGAGTSAYGILDLSGNVWEQMFSCGIRTYWYCCGLGWANYRYAPFFTGVLGDGTLDVDGNANQTNWGLSNAWGQGAAWTIVRGGNWEQIGKYAQLSDRSYAGSTTENATRVRRTGGRGVR